jgi:hypothetical protein
MSSHTELVVPKANGATEQVILKDDSGLKMWVEGTTVPTDGAAGYRKGCRFVDTDGGVDTTVYHNNGSATSCNFDAAT